MKTRLSKLILLVRYFDRPLHLLLSGPFPTRRTAWPIRASTLIDWRADEPAGGDDFAVRS